MISNYTFLDVLPEPWYSPYTLSGNIIIGVLVAAVIGLSVFLILKFFKKNKGEK